MEKTKIAIVDDHKLFRDGMAELIDKFDGFSVISGSDNGRDFIAGLDPARLPDIVILDINMKEMDGYETAGWLRENYPDIKTLALTMYENESSVIRMLRLGVRGYILKDIRKQELQQALVSLVEKGYYYTEMVTGKLIHAINHPAETKTASSTAHLASLTRKELEFLKLACTEMTYKDIADKMNLSSHTIDGYRDALFLKLNIKSRVGLVLYAIRNRIFLVD
jgi:two-component system, NarL family, invasion response regulator UvrY